MFDVYLVSWNACYVEPTQYKPSLPPLTGNLAKSKGRERDEKPSQHFFFIRDDKCVVPRTRECDQTSDQTDILSVPQQSRNVINSAA